MKNIKEFHYSVIILVIPLEKLANIVMRKKKTTNPTQTKHTVNMNDTVTLAD